MRMVMFNLCTTLVTDMEGDFPDNNLGTTLLIMILVFGILLT